MRPCGLLGIPGNWAAAWITASRNPSNDGMGGEALASHHPDYEQILKRKERNR
jgi:hypothetical protein